MRENNVLKQLFKGHLPYKLSVMLSFFHQAQHITLFSSTALLLTKCLLKDKKYYTSVKEKFRYRIKNKISLQIL